MKILQDVDNVVKLYLSACSPSLHVELYERRLEEFIKEHKDNFNDVLPIENIILKAKSFSSDGDYLEKLEFLLREKESCRIIDTTKITGLKL